MLWIYPDLTIEQPSTRTHDENRQSGCFLCRGNLMVCVELIWEIDKGIFFFLLSFAFTQDIGISYDIISDLFLNPLCRESSCWFLEYAQVEGWSLLVQKPHQMRFTRPKLRVKECPVYIHYFQLSEILILHNYWTSCEFKFWEYMKGKTKSMFTTTCAELKILDYHVALRDIYLLLQSDWYFRRKWDTVKIIIVVRVAR